MIKYLGYEDLNPKYNAYNVMVAFPFSDNKGNTAGLNVASVFIKPDVFEVNFKDVKIGSELPFNVSFVYVPYKEPQAGTYKPYFTL